MALAAPLSHDDIFGTEAVRSARAVDDALRELGPVVKLARKILPFTHTYDGQRFFVRSIRGTLMATPLLLVLLVIEWTDLVFAIDSIPAVFAITRDPFIVYSSNIFAILGLRALYFLLRSIVDKFHYLKIGIGLVLVFVGAKMLASDFFHVPVGVSLIVIVALLGGSVAASLAFPRHRDDEAQDATDFDEKGSA